MRLIAQFVRGAWGHALAGAAPQEGAERPFETLFRRDDERRPFVFAVNAQDGQACVTLTLFGRSAEWTDVATDSLLRAFRAGLGWSGEPKAIFAPTAIKVADRETIRLPTYPRHARIAFITPACLRGKGSMLPWRVNRFISKLCSRIEALGCWQDYPPVVDRARLAEEMAAITLRDERITAAPVVKHWSERQRRSIPIGGYEGEFTLEGDMPTLAALLAIGETCFVGSHCAFAGYGRYALTLRE